MRIQNEVSVEKLDKAQVNNARLVKRVELLQQKELEMQQKAKSSGGWGLWGSSTQENELAEKLKKELEIA